MFIALATMANGQAEDFKGWHDLDEATVEQHIDVETCKVYVVAKSKVQMKNKKKVAKQQAAIDAVGTTVVSELQRAFPKATFQLVADAKEAPTDALLIEACLDEIDWGNAVLRQTVGMGAGAISGTYSAKVSNAKGLVMTFKNSRVHANPFASAKGAPVINTYNEALAKDLIEALKAIR